MAQKQSTPLELIVLQRGQYFTGMETNPMIEFETEIVLERSSVAHYEPIGWAKNRMHFFGQDNDGWPNTIIWEIEYDNDDMDDDEQVIGLEFEGNKVVGYDGVMCINDYAIRFLQLLGYDTSEIELD